MTIHLLLATSNTGKQAEMAAFFKQRGLANVVVNLVAALNDVDETGGTFAENAQLKAVANSEAITTSTKPAKTYVMAEDSGFIVPALSGVLAAEGFPYKDFPGVWSNRWLTMPLQLELLGEKSQFPTRQDALDAGLYALLQREGINLPTPAYYVSSICVVAAGNKQPVFTCEGRMPLQVLPQGSPIGEHGFGYDRIVAVDQLAMPLTSLSFLTTEEKNPISHRGKSMEKLAGFLEAKQLLG